MCIYLINVAVWFQVLGVFVYLFINYDALVCLWCVKGGTYIKILASKGLHSLTVTTVPVSSPP